MSSRESDSAMRFFEHRASLHGKTICGSGEMGSGHFWLDCTDKTEIHIAIEHDAAGRPQLKVWTEEANR